MAQTLYLSPISLIVQFFQNLGLMAAGGSLSTYVAGSVNTPATTYTDSTGTVANANPMTLNSVGRPAAASGAPVAFWTLPGVAVKLVVNDALGNQLVTLDNISSVNDLTLVNNALQTLLASPTSSSTGGSGPVAGVDLVANAVKSYDVFADVRGANSPVLASGQTLNIEVQGGSSINDGLGGFFYWSSTSTTADDGRTVLKPNNLAAASAGRWLRYYPLGVPQLIEKNADQQIASSTVLANDTQLTVALAVGVYLVSLRLLLLGIGGTAQGYKVQATFSGTITGVTQGAGVNTVNGTAGAIAALINAAITAATISSTTGDTFNADFSLNVTVAGTLTVQFAQNSSSANATVMKTGSLLAVTRVA